MGNIQFQTLKQAIERKNRLVIVVHGGPCSGRTAQCKILAERLQLTHISPEALIRNCFDEEDIRKPEARLERLRRKRMYLYNAIKTHEKMTQDEKDFLGGHHEKFLHSASSTASTKQLFALREDSDTEEEDQDTTPSLIRSIWNSLKKGLPIDPVIITILIKEAMKEFRKSCNGFLIDGYPRDSSQAEEFIQRIGTPHVILYLDTPIDVLKDRIVERAKHTQRYDDNQFTIPYKFESFEKYTEPIIEEWKSRFPSEIIDGTRDISDINDECAELIKKGVGAKFKFKNYKSKAKAHSM